jgi:hypothetical protein
MRGNTKIYRYTILHAEVDLMIERPMTYILGEKVLKAE